MRSAFGTSDQVYDCCRSGEGDGRQDVEAGGICGGEFGDNCGDGGGRGKLRAWYADVPRPGTANFVDEESMPITPTLRPVRAF